MKKKDDTISIIFLRGTSDLNVSVKLQFLTLKILGGFFIFAILSIVAFVIYYSKITDKIIFIDNIIKENKELHKNVERIDLLYSEIQRIKNYEKKIKILTKNYSKESKNIILNIDTHTTDLSLYEKEIDEFVQNIKLKRNMYFVNLKDNLKKRKKLIGAIPNILPVDGWISRGFELISKKQRKAHFGIDIAAAYNTPIKAAGPGIISFSGWKKYFGKVIEIDHGYGFVSRYGHCFKLMSKKGDLVERGHIIASVGSSGKSSAPHLHFEVIKNGKKVDPLIFILK